MKDGDQSAFPNQIAYGMTLRDYFAAKMAAALLIASQGDSAGMQRAIRNSGAKDAQEWLATQAYSMADEMLKARQA